MGLFDQHMPEEIQEKVVEREVRRREAEMAPSDPINMAILAAAGWASENWWEPTDAGMSKRRRYIEVNLRWIKIADTLRPLAPGVRDGKMAGMRILMATPSNPMACGEIFLRPGGRVEGFLPTDDPNRPSFRWPPKG